MTDDPRIALLNSIADKLPPEYYRLGPHEGIPRHYAYAWFHGLICIYVGKGCDDRFLKFFVSNRSLEAHEYLMLHGDELELFFATSNIPEAAAFEIERHLVEHFRIRYDGGSLFNKSYGKLQPRPGPENQSVYRLRKLAERIAIPPGVKAQSKMQYVPM